MAQESCSSFTASIDSIFQSDFFKSAQIAIDIFDLKNDKHVYSKNETLLFRPASVEKILTTSSVLNFLDPDESFKTGFYRTGEIDDSICEGDLFVVGGFDPCFSQNDLDSTIKEIKKSGIKEIRGNLYADVSVSDSLFWGNGWMWNDDPGSFVAYLSPLNIDKNCIKVICSPGQIGYPANVRFIPPNNFLELKNNSTTIDSSETKLNISRDWLNRSNTIIIEGNIDVSSNPDTVSLNIFNPTLYFLNLMKEGLTRNGIIFNGNIDTLSLPKNANEILTLERSIDSVIVYTNKESYNLGAEMLLRLLAKNFFSKPINANKGIKLIDSLITVCGFTPGDYRIVDGSGLSFYNLISAELTTGILRYIFTDDQDRFIKLFTSFPISGFDGTLHNRMNNTQVEKHVHAKTGTLSGVCNLAGYIQTRGKNLLAFTIFIQNYVGSSKTPQSIEDKICELIYENL